MFDVREPAKTHLKEEIMNQMTRRNPMTMDELRKAAPSIFAMEPHVSRSEKYTFVPTVAVIEEMLSAGFVPFAASQSRTRFADRREFTKHMIRFRNPSQAFVNVGDVIPEIVVVNSHDGTSLYDLMAGFFRLACTNGLIVSDATIQSVKVKHMGDITAEVVSASRNLIAETARATGRISTWSQLQLTDGEQKAFAQAAHTLRFANSEGEIKTPVDAGQLLWSRRKEDSKPDLWHTFNRVQENVIRGGLSGRSQNGRRSTTREVRGIDQDVKLNRALWTLAEKMEELKAAQ
jgi:hypothetical protein